MSEKVLTVHPGRREETVNLGAGPSMLPTSVLETACQSLLDYEQSGMGITEISHRSSTFQAIVDKAEADLRSLLGIGDEFAVLFTQGGGTEQFSATALNLMARHAQQYPDFWRKQADQPRVAGKRRVRGPPADYAISGSWSAKAFKEATRLGFDAKAVFDSRKAPGAEGKFGAIPEPASWTLSPHDEVPPAFLYYCDNETVDGVEYNFQADGKQGFCVGDIPTAYLEKVPLVADMSSNILSRPIPDLERHALIFFGAQKNVGPPGVTILIVRRDLVVDPDAAICQEVDLPAIPTTLVYKNLLDNKSLYNTPSMFSIYVSGLVFEDLLKNRGGVTGAGERSAQKSEAVYSTLDALPIYRPTVASKQARSRMNITFRIVGADGKPDEVLEAAFVKACTAKAITQVKGHRSVGGIRTSLYNAVTVEHAERLVSVLKDFAAQNSQKA